MHRIALLCLMVLPAFHPATMSAQGELRTRASNPAWPGVPAQHFAEPVSVPDFWLSSVDEMERFLAQAVTKGAVRLLGYSAGGRPIRAVFYGNGRRGEGTTTFSGSLGGHDIRAYLGPDYGKKVLLVLAGVHGAEFEPIVGIANLIAVLETGRDLRGKAWPELASAAQALDRIVLIPIGNPDGRARVPIRMEIARGSDPTVHEYLNCGAWLDGTPIGWAPGKLHIPLDFSRTQFPGGYPNDAGVNFQHDDFFSRHRQPETQLLLDLTAAERPDLILNLHTGVGQKNYFIRTHRPVVDPALGPIFDEFYRRIHTRLTQDGLQGSNDLNREAIPAKAPTSDFNLNTALNLHCGALAVTIESPSHGFTGTNRDGLAAGQTPEKLLDGQLTVHLAAMKFLGDTGGRSRWTPGKEN